MSYYTYIYLDPRKPGSFEYDDSLKFDEQPFYVGCGKGNRCQYHLHEVNYKTKSSHKKNTIQAILNAGLTPTILKVHEGLTLEESRREEVKLIALIGRADQGKGPLTNGTDGGDGLANPSLETRRRIGARPHRMGADNPFFGHNLWAEGVRTLSDETRAKLGQARRGQPGTPHTEEWKRSHSVRMSGCNHPRYGKTGELSPTYGAKHKSSTIQKMSEKRRAREEQKPLTIEYEGVMYRSLKEAATKLGLPYSTVTSKYYYYQKKLSSAARSDT